MFGLVPPVCLVSFFFPFHSLSLLLQPYFPSSSVSRLIFITVCPHFPPCNPPPLHPSESYHCLRGCVRRIERTREYDTLSLKRGVIGPLQSHSNNICLFRFFPFYTHRHTHTHTNHPLPRKLPVLEKGVFGEWAEQGNTTSLKREVIWLVH